MVSNCVNVLYEHSPGETKEDFVLTQSIFCVHLDYGFKI
jgi:hypothetical protein